jgi:hypothetical protein
MDAGQTQLTGLTRGLRIPRTTRLCEDSANYTHGQFSIESCSGAGDCLTPLRSVRSIAPQPRSPVIPATP